MFSKVLSYWSFDLYNFKMKLEGVFILKHMLMIAQELFFANDSESTKKFQKCLMGCNECWEEGAGITYEAKQHPRFSESL